MIGGDGGKEKRWSDLSYCGSWSDFLRRKRRTHTSHVSVCVRLKVRKDSSPSSRLRRKRRQRTGSIEISPVPFCFLSCESLKKIVISPQTPEVSTCTVTTLVRNPRSLPTILLTYLLVHLSSDVCATTDLRTRRSVRRLRVVRPRPGIQTERVFRVLRPSNRGTSSL